VLDDTEAGERVEEGKTRAAEDVEAASVARGSGISIPIPFPSFWELVMISNADFILMRALVGSESL